MLSKKLLSLPVVFLVLCLALPGGSASDFGPDSVRIEGTPPRVVVPPLPLYSSALRDLTVSWWADDLSGSGVATYDVEIREGDEAAWQPWLTGVQVTQASYRPIPGVTTGFRVRATDNLGNTSAWPADSNAQAVTVGYSAALAARIIDTRGYPDPTGAIGSTPWPLTLGALAEPDGWVHTYYAQAGPTEVWAGGLWMPPPVFLDLVPEDAGINTVTFAMRPPQNLLVGGDFDSGGFDPAWELGGDVRPITTTVAHSGTGAALLGGVNTPDNGGTSLLAQQVAIPAGLHRPTLSFFMQPDPRAAADRLRVSVDAGEGAQPLSLHLVDGSQTGGWDLAWADLEPWAGKTIRLVFEADQATGAPPAQVVLDEIVVGAWLTPIVTRVEPGPGPLEWTVRGHNFIEKPLVYSWSIHIVDTRYVDEDTLVIIRAADAFRPGPHVVGVTNPAGRATTFTLFAGRATYLPLLYR